MHTLDWRSALRFALPLSLILPACSSSNPSGQPNQPEVFENASGRILESDLRAAIDGTTVRLTFPTTKIEQGVLSGTLHAQLFDVAAKGEPLLAEGAADFRQTEDVASHELELSGLAANLDRAKAASIAIRWSASLPRGELRGRKSLYAALGKIEVQLRGPTDIPEGSKAPLVVVVRDPDTHQAFKGATVKATLSDNDGKVSAVVFSGETNELGELTAEIALPSGVEDGSVRVEVTEGNAQAWVAAHYRVVRENRIQISTDKTIYKPGQTIELRTLSLNSAKKTPLANADVLFEALDGKGNKVFKRHATADSFGVAAMRVPTDSQVNEGTWTFRASIDGAKTEKKLPVTRYNLPKMKVSVASDREFALLGQNLHGTIEARYLFGLPVVAANVNMSARLKDGTQISAMAGQSDAQGKLTFDLPLPAQLGQGELLAAIQDGRETIDIVADVTDTANQNEQGQSTLPLVESPIVLRALPEHGSLIPGFDNKIYAVVSDPVGRPISAKVGTADVPLVDVDTDASGLAELELIPAEGQSITLTARDGAGRIATRMLTADSGHHAIVIRSDKAVYRAGETAIIDIAAPIKVDRLYLNIFKGAEGLETRALSPTNGANAAETTVTVTEAMKGLILIDAFALGGTGEVMHGTSRAFVDPEDRLDIAMVADKSTYKPGEDARVVVKVSDARGTPQVAALGLTAVDEAVFALGGEPDDDVRRFFDADARILPSGVSALGKNAGDLLSSPEDKLARVLFAAAEGSKIDALGVDYNSVREELPQIVTALTPKVRRDAIVYLASKISLAKSQLINYQNAKEALENGAKNLVDAFGQAYVAEVDQNQGTFKLTSAGPDERFDSGDDVTYSTWFGWIFYSDASQIDPEADPNVGRGGFGGGPLAEDAAQGANAPPPNAGTTNEHTADPKTTGGGSTSTKVRTDFRETVYSNPTLITDSNGQASISFPLADSITTWRLSAQGSTRDGKLGASKLGFRTFQEFFIDFDVPTTLTRNDEIELPAVVYNYQQSAQTVTVSIDQAPWMQILSAASQSVTLEPSAVKSVVFRIKAKQAGTFQLSLHGDGGNIHDAIVREARIEPDGQKEDQSFSDKILGHRDHTVSVPADAIEGGTSVTLTLTPGFAAEAVQGTESMLKEPNGCFEQTTSSAWPNTLVTTYLDVTGQLTPELRENAIGLVTRGYQRLLTFESPTGGFNWWGDNDPGNRILSAIMLWHLKDLQKLIETDDAVRDRTLSWLLAQQRADGSWASGDALHAGDEVLGTSDLRTTAFITWALAHTGWADPAVAKATAWIASHRTDSDLYATALAANAFAFADPTNTTTNDLFSKLDTLKHDAGDGKVLWPTDTPSWTGAGGDVAAIETTGLVAYGLLHANAFPENAAGAVRFIVSNKDSVGTWYNTQATVNALRALLGAASPSGSDAEGTLTITVNGTRLDPIAITKADGDVFRTIDLTSFVHAGDNAVGVDMAGSGQLSYRLTRRAYRPTAPVTAGPLALTVNYDKTSATVGESIAAHVVASYNGPGSRDQVMVRIGRAPGMAPRAEDLAALVSSKAVARYELNANDVTFYLMGLAGARTLDFHLTPTLASTAQAPGSRIYAYYDPSIRSEVAPVTFTIRGN